MNIFYHEKAQEFHLQNESVSYIMKVLKNGQIGQLYYGSAIPDKEDFTSQRITNKFNSNFKIITFKL